MNTQSSVTVALRALVMFLCLVVVPIVALFGTSLPDTIKRVLQHQFGGSVASAAASLPEAPLFVSDPRATMPVPAAPNNPSAAIAGMDPLGMPMPAANSVAANTPGNVMPGAPPSMLPPGAQFSTPAPETAPRLVNPAGTSARPAPSTGSMTATIIPAGYQTPMESIARQDLPAGGTATRPPSDGFSVPVDTNPPRLVPVTRSNERALGTATGTPGFTLPEEGALASVAARSETLDGQFIATQRRLRELGATYYLLETWGSQGELFRFYCKAAVAGNASYTRYFEATDTEPLRAMAKVLEQVQEWRAGRL